MGRTLRRAGRRWIVMDASACSSEVERRVRVDVDALLFGSCLLVLRLCDAQGVVGYASACSSDVERRVRVDVDALLFGSCLLVLRLCGVQGVVGPTWTPPPAPPTWKGGSVLM